MKCIYLQRGYRELIKDTKCMSTDRTRRNKNSEQSAYNRIRSAILFFAFQTGLLCFFFKKEILDFFAQSVSLRRLLHSVYDTAVQDANYGSLFKNMISVHTLERLFDALIIGDNF